MYTTVVRKYELIGMLNFVPDKYCAIVTFFSVYIMSVKNGKKKDRKKVARSASSLYSIDGYIGWEQQ